jgi:Flp pilus assembly CpaF family ATPase/NAD-dependent dihydropyrimidine dehydrogenase PreA subunit
MHCEDAPCVSSCPKGAFIEVLRGVYAMDRCLCDGCGTCAEKCPWNAIEIVDGKAVKCDMCIGKPKCVQVCPLNCLGLEETEEEKEKIKSILGWEKISGEYESGIYRPSYGEALLLKEARDYLRERPEAEFELGEFCDKNGIVLDRRQRKELEGLLRNETKGYSILEYFLQDDELEEIVVNGINEPVRVFHGKKGWLRTDVKLTSEVKAVDLINKIARNLGRRITLQHPRLNAVLPDGSRMHACMPPLVRSPTLTIRKFSENPFTPKDLLTTETISAEALAFLWMVMQCDFNVLICGNTGSGKTTTLNALFAFVPLSERIIIVEETPEINIPHEHSVRLVVNRELGISMSDLVSDTLRMRPDRVIVGEIRTAEETKALLDTMLAGQGKGSYATFHSVNTKEAVTRLKSLGIPRIDLAAIDIMVLQRRWNRYIGNRPVEMRRVKEICEITEDGETRKLFDYDSSVDELRRSASGDESEVEEKIQEVFCSSCLEGEYHNRAAFLSGLGNGKFGEVVEAIDAYKSD